MKKMCKVDEVFLFISNNTMGNSSSRISILEIKDHFGFKKTTMNNYLQVLFKYGVVNREKVMGKTGYYSIATTEEYFEHVRNKRIKKFNCNRHLIDKMMHSFIYSGCPERIGANMSAFA